MANYRTMRRMREWEHPPSKPYNKDGTPAKAWVVTLWEDGSYSCTCPSWCKQVEVDGVRSCKHIGRVLMALQQPLLIAKAAVAAPAAPPRSRVEKEGKRRIVLEE